MFKLISSDRSGSRFGQLKTPHGSLNTPFFMPDATRGFVKLIDGESLRQTGTTALVVNTFHLYLQPGLDIIKKAGGLHRFMDWNGPLLSDSGGFQVFSLIHQKKIPGKISDEQLTFKSPLDGSWHNLSPEKSIQIQFALGTDMMVCLDDCPPNELSYSDLAQSVKRTISWAKRSKEEYERQIKRRRLSGQKKPLLFAVIQGGPYIDLREKCAAELVKIGFNGYGFGARPVDASGNFLEEVLRKTAAAIPVNALRFALGVGTPEDIKRCFRLGWDMFDCVIPTREGRHGKLFYLSNRAGFFRTINLKNSRFKHYFKPINPDSHLEILRRHSLAFLNHLFKVGDPLGSRLASLHNLEFYNTWLATIRKTPQSKSKRLQVKT